MAAFRAIAVAALIGVACAGPGSAVADGHVASVPFHGQYLTGQLLVATPRIGDPRFAESVIFMVDHDAQGAFGLIINKAYGIGPLADLMKGLGLDEGGVEGDIRLRYGGPVQPGAGFVLHTNDYEGKKSRMVPGGLSLTTQRDVLKDIADGNGPRLSLVALGYSGWGPGQLEKEIARGDWTTAPFEEGIVFDDDLDSKWNRARGRAGVPL